jgi:pantoate--beta-alanine ligase
MLLFKRVIDLQSYIAAQKKAGKSIGFVPTMGALHDGHMTLMKKSMSENDWTICSIFVNPTQFNEKEDLDKYPRTIEADIELLAAVGCQILFLPEVEEIYPKDLVTPDFDFGHLDKTMEGAFRPGHFDGVAQVVHRLIDITTPTVLYLGQKDYQQWAIIQSMIQQLGIDVRLVRCPIARQEDGLAMSSRNMRLSKEAKAIAPNIYKILQEAKENLKQDSIQEVKAKAIHALKAIEDFNLDYFEIVDGNTLEAIDDKTNSNLIIACVALFLANVRLIDNIVLKEG